MASRKVDEPPSENNDSPSVAKHRCGPDDIVEELHPDSMNAAVKSQKSGKFRRTALTFFGVRKTICILPSFFSGRSKNQSKWSSKKGITKSRTHDGLSKVSHDDNLRGGYSLAEDFEYHNQKDPGEEFHRSCHNECSQPSADQKSLTLGRQRRGFMSLFQSFKHHRNHRNAGLDKTEMIAMSSPACKKEVPVVQDNTKQYVTECLGSEPDVPDFADVLCDVSIGPECSDANAMGLERRAENESPKSVLDDQEGNSQLEESNLMAVASSDFKENFRGHSEPCLNLQATSEPVLKSGTPAGSSDQLNLIFGDVASLKSFDSLTGCGDIIADQEDDSITESTVSGERSRNGGKRASCYLTYQGGGEEMASPEDLDETCLPEFWENNASEEMCCTCNQDHTEMTAELTSSHNMDLLNSSSAQQTGAMDTSSIADVLTPQSEHQESVPNSDEGYYDSTTPGPEEGQEKSERMSSSRLPRDSYSGDALYELFAPDENLISPHFENKSKLPPSNQCNYLSKAVDVTDTAFIPEMSRLQMSADLYEVHDFLQMPNTCGNSPEQAQNTVTQQEIGMNKNSNLNSKHQVSGNIKDIQLGMFEDKENNPAPSDKRANPVNADCEKRHSSLSFGSTSDPDFETFCEPKEEHLEENKPVALPYRNINAQPEDCNNDLDDGQTVCFSQALVDYTKHTEMMSNLHKDDNDLETNSTITPNMEALPAIVTFDVVDLHNEGEYDEQLHMELEEDVTSPYQEFEESYLQKDAFAECDYQLLDLYEQNLISNTWAVASLPRHLGLTKVSQSMPNPLSLDRRTRSLDTESLEKMPDTYKDNIAAIVSCPQNEKDSERDSSPYFRKNVVVSASEVKDGNSVPASSWQTRSEVALSLPITGEDVTKKVQSLVQTQVKRKIFPSAANTDFPSSKSHHHGSSVSDREPTELNNRQCHSSSHLDASSPHSSFVYPGVMESISDDIKDDIFRKAATNLPSYSHPGRAGCSREALSNTGSPLNSCVFNEETRPTRDVACNNLPEATFN